MAEFDTDYLKALFDKVEQAVSIILEEEGLGPLRKFQQGEKSHQIARVVNAVASTNLQSSTIQQKFYYQLLKSKELKFRISGKYHQGFELFLRIVKDKIELSSKQETRSVGQPIFNPSMPEFPESNPAFPASPHYQLPIPGFKRVWIKDESFNPTGTHKDRKAYELLIYLQDQINKKHESDEASGRRRVIEHPPVSVISSGNEAYAIQTLFALKGYRDLRVILDKSLKKSSLAKDLESLGCKLWFENLKGKDNKLDSDKVKKITENETGHDITTHLNEVLIKKRYKFYDWLSFEILNLSPDYCFIPVGTGDLYLNVLEFNKMEIEKSRKGEMRDDRFFGHVEILSTCNFIGASTKNENSKADKLFTQHNSCFEKSFQDHVEGYVKDGFCGKATRVYELNEKYLAIAMEYFDKLNITAEHSGAAGLAVFFEMMDKIPKDKTIVIVNTGKLRVKSDIMKREKTVSAIMDKLKKIREKKYPLNKKILYTFIHLTTTLKLE